MASSYSLRYRLNYQAPGDNLNLWGGVLNVGVFQLLEDATAKRVAFTLSGTKTLTTANGAADEARSIFLDVTGGTGGTVTIPSVEKPYLVRNGSSGDVIVTTGAGATVTLAATEVAWVVCDGANVRTPGFNGMGWKAYITSVAFDATGELPAQAGNAGKFVKTDGTNASWAAVTGADIGAFSASAAQIWAGTSLVVAYTPGGLSASLAEVTLTDAPTIAVDMATLTNAVVTLGGHRTLGNPTNPKLDRTGRIRVIQPPSGGPWTLSFGANWKREGGAIAVSTAANAIDFIEYEVITPTYILYNLIRNPS